MSDRACLSCEIVSGRRIASGGTIAETESFHAHQDIAYPVIGMIIVAAKRHFRCLDELTEVEVHELLPFLKLVRSAQRAVLEVDHTYYFYNEDTRHHFHIWMMPRYAWMQPFGRSIESVRPILKHAAATVTDHHREEVEGAAGKVRAWIMDREPKYRPA